MTFSRILMTAIARETAPASGGVKTPRGGFPPRGDKRTRAGKALLRRNVAADMARLLESVKALEADAPTTEFVKMVRAKAIKFHYQRIQDLVNEV